MEQNPGIYVGLGLMIGALFGVFFGQASGNALPAIAIGALGGVFIGWYIAAAQGIDNRN
ncbi:MAG: hypothetical protein KJZ95_25525 [Caldilinea sp.]|nr:hypothetical protein [Caldilinea sp.]